MLELKANYESFIIVDTPSLLPMVGCDALCGSEAKGT